MLAAEATGRGVKNAIIATLSNHRAGFRTAEAPVHESHTGASVRISARWRRGRAGPSWTILRAGPPARESLVVTALRCRGG